MKMNARAMALTGAALWGGTVIAVEAVNLIVPSYGSGFLKWMASFYPGYKARRTAGQVALGAAYAGVDGALCGVAVATLYNHFAEQASPESDKALLRAAS